MSIVIATKSGFSRFQRMLQFQWYDETKYEWHPLAASCQWQRCVIPLPFRSILIPLLKTADRALYFQVTFPPGSLICEKLSYLNAVLRSSSVYSPLKHNRNGAKSTFFPKTHCKCQTIQLASGRLLNIALCLHNLFALGFCSIYCVVCLVFVRNLFLVAAVWYHFHVIILLKSMGRQHCDTTRELLS